MNHIHAHKQRDTQTTFIDGYLLQFAYAVGTFYIKDPAQLSCGNIGTYLCLHGLARCDVASRKKIKLTQLFLKCHATHQLVYRVINDFLRGKGSPSRQE